MPQAPNLRESVTRDFCSDFCVFYGNAGRNILRADSLKQLDFTLGKRFHLTESKQLAFRSEFFNIFNHPTLNAPSGAINNSNGGRVSSTLNPTRQIQFGLKFLF